MTSATVVSTVGAVQSSADEILKIIEQTAPNVEVPAQTAEAIIDLASELLTNAIKAFSAASGVPITSESIAALMPNPEPLPLPPAGS